MKKISKFILLLALTQINSACAYSTSFPPKPNADIRVKLDNLDFVKKQLSDGNLKEQCTIDTLGAHVRGVQIIKNADVAKYEAVYSRYEPLDARNASAINRQDFEFLIIDGSGHGALITNVKVTFKAESCNISIGHTYVAEE